MKGAMATLRRLGGCRLWAAGWLALAPVGAAAQAETGGLPSAPSGQPESRIIDQVVAVIEGQVLTRSELEFETRVAFIQKGAMEAAFAPLDDEALRGGLELAINLRLQVLSADRLEAFSTEQQEVEARLADFRERFDSGEAFQAFLARSGADLKHLIEVLERHVRAGRILDSRIRPRLQVSEAEVRRHYEQHASEYPEGYTPAVKARIQLKLRKERADQLAADDVRQLRNSAQVRRVAPFVREVRR
jgi:hypothetical protein